MGKGIRKVVWDKTAGRCWYCGIDLIIGEPRNYESKLLIARWFAVDHRIPKTHGGTNHIDNLVPACWICNSAKGNKSIEEFRLHLSMRAAGTPYFTTEQVEWLRGQGFEIGKIEPIQFWAESQMTQYGE